MRIAFGPTGTYTKYAGSFVCLTIEGYPAVLAGRNGNFQWVGVSGIA